MVSIPQKQSDIRKNESFGGKFTKDGNLMYTKPEGFEVPKNKNYSPKRRQTRQSRKQEVFDCDKTFENKA